MALIILDWLQELDDEDGDGDHKKGQYYAGTGGASCHDAVSKGIERSTAELPTFTLHCSLRSLHL